MQETWVDPWVGKIPWSREMATRSSILAWKIPWTEEPDGLLSMRAQNRTPLSNYNNNLSKLWEIVRDRGAWQATAHRVAKSWT